jgi:3-oxoacid CoA-transferase
LYDEENLKLAASWIENGKIMIGADGRPIIQEIVYFNPDAATAGRTCIVEVEEIVPAGALDPDQIHLPDVYVNRIIRGPKYEKKIEFKTVSGGSASKGGKADKDADKRDRLAKRAAKEIEDGMYVNLGIGIPTLCSNFLAPGVNITL